MYEIQPTRFFTDELSPEEALEHIYYFREKLTAEGISKGIIKKAEDAFSFVTQQDFIVSTAVKLSKMAINYADGMGLFAMIPVGVVDFFKPKT